MARILAYTSPATGHVFPLVPGLLALRERGHEVLLLSPAEHVDDVRAAGVDAAPLDPRVAAVGVHDYEGTRGSSSRARPSTRATSSSPRRPSRACGTSRCGSS
jgi:UDP:flavonoid glycosyltransferase YjiC (YdhE family)